MEDMKKYIALIRAGIIESFQFRLSMLFMIIGNLVYLLFVYYLWKAIFESAKSPVVNGMTFQETMIYLVFASALFQAMEMWIAWNMGDDIKTGRIVLDLLKPMKYRNLCFFNGAGNLIIKMFVTCLPTAIIVYIITGGAIPLGINLVWFFISVCMSVMINYYINFMVGVVCMYTESIWGINIMKEVIVGILSGVTVPLAFFPEVLRNVAMVLPFQAICNSPMQLLLNVDYGAVAILKILGLQLFWMLILNIVSEWFFNISVKKITVNGG